MDVSTEIEYISCACNKTPHCADWGFNNLICYGACNAVALYDPKGNGVGKVVATLCCHNGRVNCVRWIRNEGSSGETEFVSGSSDGTSVLWTKNDQNCYSPSAVLAGHQSSVTVVDGLYIHDTAGSEVCQRPLMIATTSADSTVKIWFKQIGGSSVTCLQTLKFGGGVCLCVRLCYLPKTSSVLLLCATDDSKVLFYVQNESKEFVRIASLSGHEDWVQAIDVTTVSSDLLIATGSQDSMIRIWRVSPRAQVTTLQSVRELPLGEDIKPQEDIFSIGDLHFAVILETVLSGHEGWVYSVCWMSRCDHYKHLKLLSSSLDKTMAVWAPDRQSGVWSEEVRVGEVGGNTLGFYGSMFSPDGLSLLGHSYQGAFHMWTFCPGTSMWKSRITVGGHFDEVADLAWEPEGKYVLSVSKDQTTRLHATWVSSEGDISWHEVARPQIHGYDMSSVAVLSPYRFASGAEEKIIRVFHTPNNFVENFKRLCREELGDGGAVDLPRGASVPALGLSNKAVYENEILPEDRHVKDEYPASYFVPLELNEPPTEEHLMQNTLWPEIQKLYGHGYEIFALAAHPKGTLLASSCKATTPDHAAIILWNTESWTEQQSLFCHQLTVTQLAFSPCGSYLLSVSRDRTWGLFQESDGTYVLKNRTDKKNGVHTRIIWTCCWSSDSKYFATGSRDGKLVVWKAAAEAPTCLSVLELKGESITASAFYPEINGENYRIAVGLDSGEIFFYSFTLSTSSWSQLTHLDKNIAHHLTVKRLAFSPPPKCLLASCGADHVLKLHKLYKDKKAL